MMYSAMMTMQIAAFTFGSHTSLLRKSFLQKQFEPLPYFFARTLCSVGPNLLITLFACNCISLVTNMNNHTATHYLRYFIVALLIPKIQLPCSLRNPCIRGYRTGAKLYIPGPSKDNRSSADFYHPFVALCRPARRHRFYSKSFVST